MLNSKLIRYTLSLILLFLGPGNAFAYTPQRGNVHTILGPYIFRTNYEGEAADKGYNADSLYWVILGDVSDRGSLEITNTFMNKTFYRRHNGYLVAEKTQVVHVSAGYRRWINPWISASMALYTSYPLGDSEKIFNNFPAGQEVKTYAQENSETGLDFGLQGEVFTRGRYSLVIEGRYSWSLTKNSDEFSDQYGAAIGVRYFFQGQNTPRE